MRWQNVFFYRLCTLPESNGGPCKLSSPSGSTETRGLAKPANLLLHLLLQEACMSLFELLCFIHGARACCTAPLPLIQVKSKGPLQGGSDQDPSVVHDGRW